MNSDPTNNPHCKEKAKPGDQVTLSESLHRNDGTDLISHVIGSPPVSDSKPDCPISENKGPLSEPAQPPAFFKAEFSPIPHAHAAPAYSHAASSPNPYPSIAKEAIPPHGSAALCLDPHNYAPYIQNLWPHPTLGAQLVAPTHIQIYKAVRATGLPNYLSARILIPSDINHASWERLIPHEFDDSEILEFLKFGWPMSYTAPTPPTSSPKNHPSALAYTGEIDKFLQKELEKSAMLGPFQDLPFRPWTQISPLLTVPKKNSASRRVVIDLSFPKGGNVNDGVARNFFQGRSLTYILPSARDLADIIAASPSTCYIWKADLERAYRQLRADPLDYPLMCISHKGQVFTDICPSFGCRGSGAAQQRVSRAVTSLMSKLGHTVIAYVDDFCGISHNPEQATRSFSAFEALCADLGLRLAPEKSAPPSTTMEWLGFEFDTVQRTVTIPAQKLTDVVELANSWTHKKHCTRRELQVLAGKLMHISHCVLPARKFMSRILTALRAAPEAGTVKVNCELRRDVLWFVDYASASNGRLLLEPDLPIMRIECDACL